MGDHENIQERTKQCVKLLQDILENDQSGLEWIVCASEPVERLSQLPECYKKGMQIFAYRYLGYSHVVSSDMVPVGEHESENSEIKDLVKLADSIEETLLSELSVKCLIGIGSVSSQMKDIAKSFKEATTAIEVGAVFDTEKNIISFENLGIGRLIYQLPITLCEMFLSEVFRKGSIDSLDQETLFTIQKFFENNLNVSETSRKLFVHRNTLVYRLEKIKKLTGLDLREFDHAIVFKVALMVRKYLASREEGTR